MAVVNITPVSIPLGGGAALPTLTAITSIADGALIPFAAQDTKIVVLVKNAHASAAKTVTFAMGNGIQGVTDLTASIAAGATHAFVIESGKYKFVSGDKKGKVQVLGESTDIQVGAIILP